MSIVKVFLKLSFSILLFSLLSLISMFHSGFKYSICVFISLMKAMLYKTVPDVSAVTLDVFQTQPPQNCENNWGDGLSACHMNVRSTIQIPSPAPKASRDLLAYLQSQYSGGRDGASWGRVVI